MSQYFSYQDTSVSVGDTVRVHQRISEGDKTRVQIFEGIVVAIKGRETGKSFTVRKVGAAGVGVEKIFPVQLPSIEQIEVKRKGSVRRAKLFYLRDRIGKAANKIKEKSSELAAQ